MQFRYTDWTGERQQKLKRGFTTKREAQEWEREFLRTKRADPDMSFESFVKLYEQDIKPKIRLNTWLTKESVIESKILPYFKKRKLSEITPRDVLTWQNQMLKQKDKAGQPYSPTYLKNINNQLSAIFNHAVRFYGLHENPVRRAGAIGEKESEEMLFWTKEEFLQFIDAMMDKIAGIDTCGFQFQGKDAADQQIVSAHQGRGCDYTAKNEEKHPHNYDP